MMYSHDDLERVAAAVREVCAREAEACLPALYCPPWSDAQRNIAAQLRELAPAELLKRAAAIARPSCFACPSCGSPAINVAAGYDPFTPTDLFLCLAQIAVEMKCLLGHCWIESQSYKDGKPVGDRQRDLAASG